MSIKIDLSLLYITMSFMSKAKFNKRGVNVGCVEHRVGSLHLSIFALSVKQSALSSVVLALFFFNLQTSALQILLLVLDKLSVDVPWLHEQAFGTYPCLLGLLFSLFTCSLQV